MVAQPIPGLEAPDWSQEADAGVDLRAHARRVARERGVPENVLLGVLNHESGFNPKAWGNGGGVGQFTESTARGYGTSQAELRANPKKAIELSAQLLRDNAEMFSGDYEKGAAAYFVGASNVQQAERQGGLAGWLPALDVISRKYNQGTVSSYLQKTIGGGGGAGGGVSATSSTSGNPAGDYVFPVQDYRDKVNLHWGSDKGGADLFAPRGTPVKAMTGGRVTSVGTSGLGGNNVTIRGNDGRDYYYAHGDRAPEVKVGQTIPTGQYLFGVGDSGNAKGTGTHLHLGIGNGIISGTGATGGSGRDFDAVGLLSAVLSGGPTPPPSGAEGGASAARAMLGDTAQATTTAPPRRPISEVLGEARERREQELESLTDIEPVPDIGGGDAGLGLPSIRPPSVGDAGLASLGGGSFDMDTRPRGRSMLDALSLPELGPGPGLPSRSPDVVELGSRFRAAEPPPPPPSMPSILDPGQGGLQYTEEGARYVDPSARGTLRGELEARRQGESQYGRIPEVIKEKPLDVAAVAAMGLAPSFAAGSGLATLPGAGIAQQLIGGAIAQPYITEGLNAIPGYENLPGPAKAIAENAPFSVLGKARIPVKVGEAVLGGLGLYGGQQVDEAVGGPELPIVGGFGGLVGGLAGGVGGAIAGSRIRPRMRVPLPEAPPVQQRVPQQVAGAPATVKPPVSAEAYDYRIFKPDGSVDVVATAIKALLDLRDPVTAIAREGFEGGAFGRALNIIRKSEGFRQEEEATAAAEERSAARQATAPRDPILGKTPAERRYGERTRQGVLEHGGEREVALVEGNLQRSGQTWADFGDAQQAFAQGFDPNQAAATAGPVGGFRGDPNNPADVAASMRESVQAVRDERAGLGAREQMGAAQRRLRGGGGPQAGIVPLQRIRNAPDTDPIPGFFEVMRMSVSEVEDTAARYGVDVSDNYRDLPGKRSVLIRALKNLKEAGPPRIPMEGGMDSIHRGDSYITMSNLGKDEAGKRVITVSVGREGAADFEGRNPEGSDLRSLTELAEVINELRARYPDDIFAAGATDPRRDRIYRGVGFRDPTAEEYYHPRFPKHPGTIVLGEGLDTRPRALRGGGTPGGAMGIVPNPRGRQNPVQPEDIAFGEENAPLRRQTGIEDYMASHAEGRAGSRPNPLAGLSDDEVRHRFDLNNTIVTTPANARMRGVEADMERARAMDAVRTFGEELYRRTGGAEGIAPQGPGRGGPAMGPGMGIVPGGPGGRPRQTAAGPPEHEVPQVKLTKGLPTLAPKVLQDMGPLEQPPQGEPKGFVQQPEPKAKAVVVLHNHPELHEAGPVSRNGQRVGNMWVGDLPETPDWVAMTEDAASVEKIEYWRRYYKDNRNYMDSLFQMATPEEAARYRAAFNRGNVRTSSEEAAQHVFQIEDRLAGLPRPGEGSMNAKSIAQALEGSGESFGVGPKISDFDDSHLGKTTRSWAGDDPRAGSPFTGDTHTSRDAGFIDQVMEQYILKKTGKTLKQLGLQFDKVPVEKGSNGFVPSDAQFELINRWGNKLTKELNAMNDGKGWLGHQWTTEEVQAVGWGRVRQELGEPDSGFKSIRDYSSRALSIPWVAGDPRLADMAPNTLRQVNDQVVESMMRTIGENVPQARLAKLPGDGLEGARWNVTGSTDTMEEVAKAIAHINEGPVLMYRRGMGQDRHVDLLPGRGGFSVDEIQAVAAAVQPWSRGISYTNDGLRVFGIPGGERGKAGLIAAIDQALPETPVHSEWGTGQVTPIGEGGTHADYLAEISGARPDLGGALNNRDSLRAAWLDEALAGRASSTPAPGAPGPGAAPRGGGGAPGAAAGIIGGRAGGRPRPPGAGETGAVRLPGGIPGRLGNIGAGALNEAKGAFSAPVALKSMLSPPLFRQGLARVMTNPAAAFREFAQSMRVTFNEARAAQMHDALTSDDWVAATEGRDAAAQAAYQARWDRAGPVERSNMKPPTAGTGPHAGHTWQDVHGQVLDWRDDALEGKSLAELKALADRAGTKYNAQVTSKELSQRLKADLSSEELSLMTDSAIGRATARIGRSSNRQSSTMMNLMRINWYKEVAEQMEKAGITEVEPYEELRKTIEQFTQRGSWAQPLKLPVFFSTRAMSGRIQQVARGVNATLSPGEVLGGPGAKREAAKAFYAMTAGNLAMLGGIYAAASAAGLNPSIEMDGKLPTLKVGPHRWDPWAGANTPARAAFGVVADTLETIREDGIQNAPQGFIQSVDKRGTKLLQGGLSPIAGKINDARKGYDFTGQKYNLFEDLTDPSLDNFFIDVTEPFITAAMRDAVKEDSPLAAGVIAGPAFLSTGINSYRTPADVADEKARAATGKSLDELGPVQRLKYIDPEDRTQTGPLAAARDHFKTALEEAGYVETEKAPKGETLQQSKAREARNAPISQRNQEVLRRNPELEVQDWYFSGKHGGALNSAPAVTQALALNLPEREVRYRGADRNLATAQGKRLWSESRRDIQDFYDPKTIRQNMALAEEMADRRHNGRSYNQLTAAQKADIDSDVRTAVRQNNPELDALMAYMGFGGNSSTKRYLVHSTAAMAPLERLRARYGRAPAKDGWNFALAANAR